MPTAALGAGRRRRAAGRQVGMVSRPATVRPFFGAEATWVHARGDGHAGKVGLMRDTGQARGLDLQPGTKFMGLKLKIWARKGVKMALKYPRVP